jgi:hypothetical protein
VANWEQIKILWIFFSIQTKSKARKKGREREREMSGCTSIVWRKNPERDNSRKSQTLKVFFLKKKYYDICPLNIPSPAKTYTLAPLPTQENLRHTNSSLSPPTPLPLISLSLNLALSTQLLAI